MTAGEFVAPIRNMQQIAPNQHLVQFYEKDEYLVQTIASFFAQGFVEGNSAVLIATRQHRTAVAQSLRKGGVDLEELQSRGQYLAFDAETILARFMINGHPDARRFRAEIGPVLELAAESGSAVRVFGEMVACLWGTGDKAAAIELEFLWNDLADYYQFALLCGYPIAVFSEEDRNGPLTHVCRAHQCVIPHESYCDLEQPRG